MTLYRYIIPFQELEEELFRYCAESKYILIFGDFNSRTSDDYVQIDKSLCDMHGLQDLYDENASIISCLENSVPSLRKTLDKTVNTYGHSLLDPCKNNDSFILTGRVGEDAVHCPISLSFDVNTTNGHTNAGKENSLNRKEGNNQESMVAYFCHEIAR